MAGDPQGHPRSRRLVNNDFDPAEDGENSDNDDPSELIQISESETEDEWGYGRSWR
jgi:hypothetical protein